MTGQQRRTTPNNPYTTPTDDTTQDWWERSACNGHDPEMWFAHPTETASIAFARSICRGCSVRDECVADEVGTPPYTWEGIRGGLTAEERVAAHPATTRPT